MKKKSIKPKKFDYGTFEKEAIAKLRAGKGLTGEGGVFTDMIGRILEAALSEEMEGHLSSSDSWNRRNGSTSKKIRTSMGNVQLQPPRDRHGTFNPQIVKKWSRSLAPEIESQIISLYSMGTSYQDIHDHIKQMYGISYSPSLISSITDRVYDELEKWKNRPLENIYAFIYLDAIHYKVREDRQVKTKAIYTVLGVDLEGNRDVLGLYIGASEGAKHWARILDGIKDRGVEDVLFFCVDGLKGISSAISSVYPESIIQKCIVHMVRTSLKYVSWKDYKSICKDLRKIYQSIDRLSGESELERFGKKWDDKYPEIRRKWEEGWLELSAFFDYPEAVRRVIYTTNAVEALHRILRKITKTKGAFVSDKALEKQLYLGLKHSEKSWKKRVRSWPELSRTLFREFPERTAQWTG